MRHTSIRLSYTPRKYIPELDGVRGIAVAAVILYHCFPSTLTRGGWMGVDLFFVLSGFLITGILVDSKAHPRYYVNFISRRILRIFPLYYLVLVIVLFVLPSLWRSIIPPHFNYYQENQGWFWLYLQNWLFSKSGFPKNHLLIHFWSLGVEEQFYLVWPWVVKYIPRRHLIKVSIFLCLIGIVFRLLPGYWTHFNITYRYMSTLSRIDALLIGAMIAVLIRDNLRLLEKITIPVCIISLGVFLVGLSIVKSINFLALPPFYTSIDLLFGSLLLISISSNKRIKRIVKQPFLIQLGKYSYGLYVYHYIIFVLLEYNLTPWLSNHLSSSFLRMLIVGSLSVVLTVGISILSYYFFESYFLKLKKYFPYTKKSPNRLLSKIQAVSTPKL